MSQGPLGGARMQYHWRMSMTFLGAYIFGTPEVFVGNAQTKFDKDTLALTDQPTKDAVKAQLAAFAKYIERMKVLIRRHGRGAAKRRARTMRPPP